MVQHFHSRDVYMGRVLVAKKGDIVRVVLWWSLREGIVDRCCYSCNVYLEGVLVAERQPLAQVFVLLDREYAAVEDQDAGVMDWALVSFDGDILAE